MTWKDCYSFTWHDLSVYNFNKTTWLEGIAIPLLYMTYQYITSNTTHWLGSIAILLLTWIMLWNHNEYCNNTIVDETTNIDPNWFAGNRNNQPSRSYGPAKYKPVDRYILKWDCYCPHGFLNSVRHTFQPYIICIRRRFRLRLALFYRNNSK